MNFDRIFDHFWDTTVPFPWNQNQVLKRRALIAWNDAIAELAKAAGTPEGVRSAAAMLKIGRILLSARVILNDPNPDPEKITTAIQALVDRLKIKGDTTP